MCFADVSKWKHTVNPKLLDDDNVSNDAIKCHKLKALKAKSVTQISAPQALSNVSHSNSSTSRHASVKAVDDNENIHLPNAGSSKNTNTIIEQDGNRGLDLTSPAVILYHL